MSYATNCPICLVILDYQNDIIGGLLEKDRINLLKSTKAAINAARARAIPIIFVKVAFRPGYPEVNLRNKMFAGIVKQNVLTEGKQGTNIHEGVHPEEGDIVLTKRRLGAFAGTELEALLRSRGVTKLVLAGISTSGVVLSTLRWASDLDYDVTVLSDCCGDRDEEVHSMLMAKVFPRQATVMNSASWIDSL